MSRKAIALIVVVFCLYFAVRWIKRSNCPPVQVPKSHFVSPSTKFKNKKVIIFVHGVLGDMDNTWTNKEQHVSWPDLLAHDLTDYDVYVYGYKTTCNDSDPDIREIATEFGSKLQNEGFFSNYEEIHFIAHSMGGLVTQRMLVTLNTADPDKLQRIHTVLLIAVPSAGADAASWAEWLSSNPQFRNMDPVTARTFLGSVQEDWGMILSKRNDARPFPRVFAAYEKERVAGFKLIVPELFSSQTSDLPAVPVTGEDHISIVKPVNTGDFIYIWAKGRIQDSAKYLATGKISVPKPLKDRRQVSMTRVSERQLSAILLVDCVHEEARSCLEYARDFQDKCNRLSGVIQQRCLNAAACWKTRYTKLNEQQHACEQQTAQQSVNPYVCQQAVADALEYSPEDCRKLF